MYLYMQFPKLKSFKAIWGSYRAEAQSNPCSVHRWNPFRCCVQTNREHLFQTLDLFGSLSGGLCKENGAYGYGTDGGMLAAYLKGRHAPHPCCSLRPFHHQICPPPPVSMPQVIQVCSLVLEGQNKRCPSVTQITLTETDQCGLFQQRKQDKLT